jgi:hypothetical protein
MMEAVRTSETSVDNYFTRQYIPEDNSEHHTRRRENLKSHNINIACLSILIRRRITDTGGIAVELNKLVLVVAIMLIYGTKCLRAAELCPA